MHCYGPWCVLRDCRKVKIKTPRYGVQLRPNSACSLSWSKNLHFRPLAPGLMSYIVIAYLCQCRMSISLSLSFLTSCRMCLGSMSPVEFKKCPCRPVDFRGLPPYHNPFPFPPMSYQWSYLRVYFYEELIVKPKKIYISQDVQVGTTPFSVFRVLFLFITQILGMGI